MNLNFKISIENIVTFISALFCLSIVGCRLDPVPLPPPSEYTILEVNEFIYKESTYYVVSTVENGDFYSTFSDVSREEEQMWFSSIITARKNIGHKCVITLDYKRFFSKIECPE